jgi:cation transport protein ChaC
MQRFRGTVDQPGLMMALEPGGQCKGVVYDLPRDDLEGQLSQLFRREFTFKPANTTPRWIVVRTGAGQLSALSFVINRESPNYAGRLTPQEVAEVLSRACGHWGTGAEYLLNTVTQLEQKGIRDSNLWRLQKLVAERIEQDHGAALAG